MSKYRIRVKTLTKWQSNLEREIRKFSYELKYNAKIEKVKEKEVKRKIMMTHKIQKEIDRWAEEYKNALSRME